MTITEFTDTIVKDGGPADAHRGVLKSVFDLTNEMGAVEDTATYIQDITRPDRFIRFACWDDFFSFNAAFFEVLSDGSLDDWSEVFDMPRTTAYAIESPSWPFKAPAIGLLTFYLTTEDEVEQFEKYIDEILGPIEKASGWKPAAGWNIEGEEPNKNEFILMCGWSSHDQHRAFFKPDYQETLQTRMKFLDRVEEFLGEVIRLDGIKN